MPVPILDLAAEYRSLRTEIDAAVARVVDRTAFVGGEEVLRFEAELAAYLGAAHVIGVANGSDAIELALQGLGIGAGDAVLTVPFTFAATLQRALTARGIGTGIHYPRPLHRQEGYRHLGHGAGAFPVAERAAAEVLSLPMSPFLADAQVDEVAGAVRAALA